MTSYNIKYWKKVKGKTPSNIQKVCVLLYLRYLLNKTGSTIKEIAKYTELSINSTTKILSILVNDNTLGVNRNGTHARYYLTERGLDYGKWVFDNNRKLDINVIDYVSNEELNKILRG